MGSIGIRRKPAEPDCCRIFPAAAGSLRSRLKLGLPLWTCTGALVIGGPLRLREFCQKERTFEEKDQGKRLFKHSAFQDFITSNSLVIDLCSQNEASLFWQQPTIFLWKIRHHTSYLPRLFLVSRRNFAGFFSQEDWSCQGPPPINNKVTSNYTFEEFSLSKEKNTLWNKVWNMHTGLRSEKMGCGIF